MILEFGLSLLSLTPIATAPHAPVPQASVIPAPRSQTPKFASVSDNICTNSTFIHPLPHLYTQCSTPHPLGYEAHSKVPREYNV